MRLFRPGIYNLAAGYVELSRLPRTTLLFRPLGLTSSAVLVAADGRVAPICGGTVIRITPMLSLTRPVADVRNHESGFSLFPRGKGRVRKIQNGNRKDSKVAVLQMHRLLQIDGSLRSIKFPGRPIRVAHRHPRFLNMICMFVQPLRLIRLKVEWVGANKQSRCWVPLNRKRGAH